MTVLDREAGKALSYLRRRYKVSERDLVALARKFKVREPEESWEEIVQRSLRNKQSGRFVRSKHKR
jgi:hypothetical protein